MGEVTFATPQEAEEAFYAAFEKADLGAMAEVWADDDAIVCVHPGGHRQRGREAVLESWRRIFMGGAPLAFEIDAATCIQDAWLAIHCVHENIAHGRRLEQRTRVIATNVYRLTDEGWRLVVHHASPSLVDDDVTTEETEEPVPPRRLH